MVLNENFKEFIKLLNANGKGMVLGDQIQQINKQKKNQTLSEIVYFVIEIKQKIRYDHRQSHL